MSPRRGPGEGSISQRPDGRWQVRVELGQDETGKRRRKYLYADTQAAAVELLHQAQKDRRRGRLAAGTKTTPRTVGAWLDEWLETIKTTREPNTSKNYAVVVNLHLKPALGRVRLGKLTAADVQRFLTAKAAGYAPATVERLHAVLSSALSRAVKRGLLGHNVAEARLLDLPRAERQHAQRALTLEEAKAFIASARTDRLYALYLTALVLGQRQSEMLGMRWRDVDFDGGRLGVVYKLVRVEGAWQLRQPKAAGSRHTLPLLAPVAAALREHQIRQEWERQVAGGAWRTLEHDGRTVELVFTSSRGGPMWPAEVRTAFAKALKKAGLAPIHFHDLRHSAASIMLALGVPLKTVSAVLGHSSTKMTGDVYGHLTEDVIRAQLAHVEEAWSEDRPGRPAREAR